MPTLDAAHTWQFTIDGVDVTDYVEPTSVAMTDAEGNEVDTLYVELTDQAGSLSISDWQKIAWIIDPGTVDELVWFGGFVVNAERSAISGGQGMVWRVKCEGYITLLARLPAGLRSWVDAYPGNIVIDLLDQAGLTSQDSEQRFLAYLGDDGTLAEFEDSTQDFEDWKTTSGDAGYAIVVTNDDGTISWGYLGDIGGASSAITIYSDLALTTRGWKGMKPVSGGKTPESYHVRRAELFSGHQPIDTTNVQTGDNTLLSFGTTADETVAQVITRLSKQLGWVWRVDGLAQLYFGEATSDPAPFNVSDGANATYVDAGYFPARADTFTISGANGMEIRNRVVLHGGAKASTEESEIFYGSATGRIYQLAHRNLIDITVLVNGMVVADGTVWWNTFDDRIVLVNYVEGWIWFVEDFLILGDTIQVIYRYWSALEWEQRDETSIEQRRQVFTYEITDRSITTKERAYEVATQILADYSGGRYTGSFEVWRLGLRAGQDIKLKFPGFGIDSGFTIRKMDCRIDPSNTGLVVYCEFGSHQMQLSETGWSRNGPLTTDQVWLSQIGPYSTNIGATIPKPYTGVALALAKQYTVVVDATSNDMQIMLPPALTCIGHSMQVIRTDTSPTYTVELAASNSEEINGEATFDIGNQGNVVVSCFSDGARWYAHRSTPNRGESAYTIETNSRFDRTFDTNNTTLNEVADVLATLIGDLQVMGLVA